MNTQKNHFIVAIISFLLSFAAAEIDTTEIQPVPHYTKNIIKVHTFTQQKEDKDVSWVAVTAERKIVELFANAQVMVLSHLLQSPSSLKPDYQIKGNVKKKGSLLTAEITLTNKKGNEISSGSITGTIQFFKRIRNVLGETAYYALDIREKVEKKDAIDKPTSSNSAYALYLLAKQRVLSEQPDRAIKLLLEAVKEDPKFAMACWILSQIYNEKGGKDSAAVWNNKAVEIDSMHPRWPSIDSVDKEQPLKLLLDVSKKQAFEAIDSGLTYKYTELEQYGFSAIVWYIDPELFTFDIELQSKNTGNYIKEFFRDERTILAINAGFFEMNGQYTLSPSGLIVSNGKMVFPATDHGGSGILCLKKGKPEIKWAKDTINPAEYELAFQCGPILVEHGGTIGVYNNNYRRLNRAAIGISEGNVVVAIVVGEKNIGLSLYEFARYLRTPKEKGGAGCDVALNLDGGSSAQVRFYYRGIIININGLWAINSAVVVKRKKL